MDFSKKAQDNVILKVRVGSHLFGTDTEDSDLDLYGIFMPFDETVYGSYRCDDVKLDIVDKDSTGRNTKDAVDFTLAEYRKFIKLATQNNPNILHILFANDKNILHMDDFGKRLLDHADLFPCKEAKNRFTAYARSQMHKMTLKPMNHAALVEGARVLSFFPHKTVLAEVAQMNPSVFKDLGPGKHVQCGDIRLERNFYVSRARITIKSRLDAASHRAKNYAEFGIDVKFASNLIHLLLEGIELLNTGRVRFPLAYRQDILDVKQGRYKLPEILSWAEQLLLETESAYESSSLPAKPRVEEIEEFAMSEVKRFLR